MLLRPNPVKWGNDTLFAAGLAGLVHGCASDQNKYRNEKLRLNEDARDLIALGYVQDPSPPLLMT
jgi:hypothetical protein